jgi:hypothetical protein
MGGACRARKRIMPDVDPEQLAQTRERLQTLRNEVLQKLLAGDLSMLSLLADLTAALKVLEGGDL